MTRRITRQRHRRRRSSETGYDPNTTESTESEFLEAGFVIPDEPGAPEGNGTGVGFELSANGELDEETTHENEAYDEAIVEDTIINEDLEDTAADPVLEAAAGSDRQPIHRQPEQSDTEDPSAYEDPDHPEAFGRWLRSQRELRGIRLRAIADSSKIGLSHLKALETGRFDLLPADVFTKGFLRQYAGFVGLDPEEAINFYLAASERTEEEEDLLRLEPPPKEASPARWVLVALLLAGLLLGVVWVLSRLANPSADSEGGASPTSARTADTSRSEIEPSAPQERGAVPQSTVRSSPASDLSSPAQVASAIPEAAGAAEAEALPPDVPLRIVLDFSDTCWVSALLDGSRTREKVHAQGESLTLDAQRSVELKVGNYRAVELEVNGMPYDLRSRGRTNTVVRTVVIDLETVRTLRGSGSSSGSPDNAASGAVD